VDYAIDSWVIPSQPDVMFGKNGEIDFDVLLGATTSDTLAGPPYEMGDHPPTIQALETMLTQLIVNASKEDSKSAPQQAASIVAQYSKGMTEESLSPGPSAPPPAAAVAARMWQQINADICVVCPTKQLADDMSSSKHGGAGGPTPYLYQYAGSAPDGMAPHYDDVYELFGSPPPEGRTPSDPYDPVLSRVVQDYWGSFSAAGVPRRPPGSRQPSGVPVPPWPVYIAADMQQRLADADGSSATLNASSAAISSSSVRGGGAAVGGLEQEMYMVLAPEVQLRKGYQVTTPCEFWANNFSEAVLNHLCYETNPTPRRGNAPAPSPPTGPGGRWSGGGGLPLLHRRRGGPYQPQATSTAAAEAEAAAAPSDPSF